MEERSCIVTATAEKSSSICDGFAGRRRHGSLSAVEKVVLLHEMKRSFALPVVNEKQRRQCSRKFFFSGYQEKKEVSNQEDLEGSTTTFVKMLQLRIPATLYIS